MNELQESKPMPFKSLGIAAAIEIVLVLILGFSLFHGMASFIFGYYFQ